jgi:transcriptional regulator with XRE-family HTH domain
MNIAEKEMLTQLGDMGKNACSVRLLAARMSTGMTQSEASQQSGVPTNSLNNMERGRQFPNREIMRFYFRAHRIDFNFLMHGDFAQLPADVQAQIFDALPSAKRALDQTTNSDQSESKLRPARS